MPCPYRILFIDHTAKMGGGEIALLNLVRNLDAARYQPVVALFSEGPLEAKLRAAGIETHVVPLGGRVLQTRKDSLGIGTLLRARDVASALGHVRRMARFIKRQRIDLVHTNSLKADLIGGLAARLARKPLIWHVRDRIDSDYLPRPVVHVFRWLGGILPHRIIANSGATLGTLELAREERGEAVPSGIDLRSRMRIVHDGMGRAAGADAAGEVDGIAQADRAGADNGTGGTTGPGGADAINGKGRTNEDAETSPDRPGENTAACAQPAPRLVGLVGRISPWKGQHVFLQAAAIVHGRFPEVRFQIIGAPLFAEQEYEQELKGLCTSLNLNDCVEFTGFQENVAGAIEKLEILVHASTSGEPFGQVVIEGMAAGKPVVATNGGGIPEIVLDGVTGLLVPMGQAAPMARAICHLLQNQRLAGEMGLLGRQRVHETFTIAHTAAKVERLYDELLGGDRGAAMPAAQTVPGSRHAWAEGATAVAATVAYTGMAAALTVALRNLLHEHAPIAAPMLAAVALCASLYGRAIGFVAAGLGACAMAYLVLPPQISFRIEQVDQPAFVLFVLVALLLAQLIGMLNAARRREERARRHAEDAREDLDFVARSGAALSVPTCAGDLLATICYLAESRLCEQCRIDVASDDGTVRRVCNDGTGARAGGVVPSLQVDGRSYPLADPTDPADPAAAAIRTGKPVFMGTDDFGVEDALTADERRVLPPRALMAVPLIAKGRTLGALTLVRGGPRCDFRARDLKLATEFAWRSAMALATLSSGSTDSTPPDEQIAEHGKAAQLSEP